VGELIPLIEGALRNWVEEVASTYAPVLLRLVEKCAPGELAHWLGVVGSLRREEVPLSERYAASVEIKRRLLSLVEEGCVE